ncbi:MAG: SusD/RagB family nutrient-binding outer membrane lipoprotein [Bacteroidales bacterium]|nr:SusD/RagB family nutrient-binding outer membrane lipoprotein [Bacteroidales bacterium]
MKNQIKLLLFACAIVVAQGCTEIMEDMNNDPKRITMTDLQADGELFKQHIITMEKNLFNLTSSWMYQVQQNLNADVFAGYTMHPASFNRPDVNSNYNWNHGWNSWAFIVAQTNLTEYLALARETGNGAEYGDFYSYGLILKILTALPLVDGFGPFPYLEYGVGLSPKFDNVNDIYKNGFLPELNIAIDTLKAYAAGAAADRVKNSGADISNFGGDITNWIKLANTLKLRLAMRISNADPTTAAEYITEVVNDSYGVLDENTGDFSINTDANGVFNPFSFISTSWIDCVMSSDMQSFMTGMQDPRLGAYFLPATSDTVIFQSGTYAGMRAGIELSSSKGHYAGYSQVKVGANFLWVSGAESYFLLAEAATRNLGGLSSGKAKEYYEKGVAASFVLRGLSEAEASDYLASTATPANYIDYNNHANNYSATTAITPKWDDAKALEQIITQKWIAVFPLGAEAWAEFRRTGFPKLVIPKNMESSANFDGTLKAGEFLKRMPYPSNILSISPDQATLAISSYLNGKDDAAQKLWWDVD